MEILPLVIIFAFIIILFSPNEEKSDKEPDEEYELKVYKKKNKKEDKD